MNTAFVILLKSMYLFSKLFSHNFRMKSRVMLKFTNDLLVSKLTYFMKLLNFSFDIDTTY